MPTVLPMTLNLYPTPILKEKCAPVVVFGDQLNQIKEQMTALMYLYNGRGIAAPQCGLSARICIVDMGEAEPAIFINPEYKPLSDEVFDSTEGCLSLPGLEAKFIKRYKEIEVKAQDIQGNEFVAVFTDKNSAAVQHEIDHLDGITILDRVGSVQRELLLKKYKKITTRIKLYNDVRDKMRK